MSRNSFLFSTIRSFNDAVARSLVSERLSTAPYLLQQFDPRVRLISIFLLILATVFCRRLSILTFVFAFSVLLAIASHVSVWSLVKRVWVIVFVFTGLIALPALFTTSGEILVHFPGSLSITKQGLRIALMLVLRVETTATLTTTLVLCTAWNRLLRGLRSLGIPSELIVIAAMTHRYIFLLIETANQMFESRISRTVGVLGRRQERSITTQTAAVLLSKSLDLSHEVYLAMMARGFRGDIRLLGEQRLRIWDFVGLISIGTLAALMVWVGR